MAGKGILGGSPNVVTVAWTHDLLSIAVVVVSVGTLLSTSPKWSKILLVVAALQLPFYGLWLWLYGLADKVVGAYFFAGFLRVSIWGYILAVALLGVVILSH